MNPTIKPWHHFKSSTEYDKQFQSLAQAIREYICYFVISRTKNLGSLAKEFKSFSIFFYRDCIFLCDFIVSHLLVAGCQIDKSSVTYSCRSCKKSGFASSEIFLEHSCCDEERAKLATQQPQKLDHLEKLFDVKDIQWKEATGNNFF